MLQRQTKNVLRLSLGVCLKANSWEQRKLGDNVQFYSGLTYSPHNIIGSDGTLVLRSSNVKNSEIVHADDVYVEPNIVNSENVKVGDVIVVVRNGSRSLIGKHAQIKEEMPSTVIGAFMTGIRYSCPEFLNALLSTSKFNKEIEKDLGATINQITTGSFKNMEFNFTNSKEETKIGTFFSKLDNLITLHQCEQFQYYLYHYFFSLQVQIMNALLNLHPYFQVLELCANMFFELLSYLNVLVF